MKKQSPKNKFRLIFGVTGSFGSGKTTVAAMFKKYGASVIDADNIAHKLISPGQKAYRNVVNIFGEEILKKNRRIDRVKLAKVVFNNKVLLGKLNKAVHPEVIKAIKAAIAASSRRYIVLDAPLLIEAGLEKLVDKLVVVKASRDIQIKRVLNKTSLDKKEISKRISAQMPLRKKALLADFVIDNNGSISNTKKQIEKVFKKVLSSQGQNRP